MLSEGLFDLGKHQNSFFVVLERSRVSMMACITKRNSSRAMMLPCWLPVSFFADVADGELYLAVFVHFFHDIYQFFGKAIFG